MWIAVLTEATSSDAKKFERQSGIITDIINRHLALKKVKIPGVKKIAISLTSAPGINFVNAPLKGFSPVVNIRRTYDFGLFSSSREDQKNEIILSLIETSLKEASEKFNWDFAKLEEATNEVRNVGFKQRYLVWKPKSSKDKKYKAGVEVDMLINEASIAIVFYSADEASIKKIRLISVRPDRLFIVPLMGEAKWISNTEFELTDKRKEIHFKTSLLKDKPEVYFTPVNRDRNAVIDDLLILSASTSDKQALALLREKIDGLTS